MKMTKGKITLQNLFWRSSYTKFCSVKAQINKQIYVDQNRLDL